MTRKKTGSSRIDGLSVAMASSPYEAWTGVVLDLRGPWTDGLVEAWIALDDPTQPVGLAAWEGSAIVGDGLRDRHRLEFVFEGRWRELLPRELEALGAGDRPLTMKRFPSRDALLPTVPPFSPLDL